MPNNYEIVEDGRSSIANTFFLPVGDIDLTGERPQTEIRYCSLKPDFHYRGNNYLLLSGQSS